MSWWTCSQCKQIVPWGNVHYCPTIPAYDSQPAPTTPGPAVRWDRTNEWLQRADRLLELLERIVVAIEGRR